jgi:hypothetical protein
LNLSLRGPGVFVEKSLRSHNDATDTKAALRRAFFNECLLNWMRLSIRADSFERGDILTVDRLERGNA